MVFFNYALRKLNAKIVYYGPGLCGKTTNLQWIHDNFQGGDKGKMVSLATEGDRTIFFDLLPLDIGTIRGMDVTLQLYTVPGQVHYNSTRQLVLRGADGVVFVADSQRAMQSSNTDSLKNLDENLGLQGFNLAKFPHVIQFNKRDLGDLMTVEDMDGALNRYDAPFFEAVAVEGIGIHETLEGIVRLVMRSLKDRYEARGLGIKPSHIKPASVAGPRPIIEIPGSAAPSGPMSIGTAEPPVRPDFSDGGVADSEQPLESSAFDAQPVPFEEIDTQTEVLVPPPVTHDAEEFPVDPADRLPTGPGLPVESEDEIVSVAQYDTAEVEELQDSLPDDGEAPHQETVFEPEDVGSTDDSVSAEVDESPTSMVLEEEPQTDQEHESVFDIGNRDAVDDILASVIGVTKTVGPPLDPIENSEEEMPLPIGREELFGAEAVPGFDVEIAPEEIDLEQPAPQRDVFDFEPGPSSDIVEEPPPTQDIDVSDVESPLVAEGGGEAEEVVPEPFPETTVVVTPHRPSTVAPVVFGDSDPFSDESWEQPNIELPVTAAVVVSDVEDRPPVLVSAGDNSLAVKLTGTGAIIESGQVRELDIEVPVPGTWVGNRKVTLQLRLTLVPITEDENDGTTGPA